MSSGRSSLSTWTPDQITQGRRSVAAWRRAGPALDRIRRRELRALDVYAAIAHLCGPADYSQAPRAPKPTSGLLEQQRLFQKLRPRP